MLDRPEPYQRLRYFFSDQYDVGMEYIGLHGPDDRLGGGRCAVLSDPGSPLPTGHGTSRSE